MPEITRNSKAHWTNGVETTEPDWGARTNNANNPSTDNQPNIRMLDKFHFSFRLKLCVRGHIIIPVMNKIENVAWEYIDGRNLDRH